jgi:hypothetical protein
MSVFVDLQAAEGEGALTIVAMEMEHGASSSLARRVVVRLVTGVSTSGELGLLAEQPREPVGYLIQMGDVHRLESMVPDIPYPPVN